MKLIDLHKEWAKNGRLSRGLCNNIPNGYKSLLKLFKPTRKDLVEIYAENLSATFWACGINDINAKWTKYTPLRQTIVLFICAMKGELK